MNKHQNIEGVKQLSREQLKSVVGGDDCGCTMFACQCCSGLQWQGCYSNVVDTYHGIETMCPDGGSCSAG
jgi:hypothetical protein